MVVEKGPRLVPATASDAERLDTWRVGSEVNVQFVRNGSRVMERKWWAVLGLVVDRCNVPWNTKEQASEAVKLALDIVHMTKTVGNNWMLYPKSLTELDDAELDKAVSQMMDLITKMTGIDPETLRRETSDVGRDETEQPEAAVKTASGSGSGEAHPPQGNPAPEQSASAVGREDGAEPDGASAGDDAPSSDLDNFKRMLMQECVENMLRDAFSEPAIERPAKVDKLERIFLEKQNLGSHPHFVKLCAETMRRIIGKPQERARAREYLMGKIG